MTDILIPMLLLSGLAVVVILVVLLFVRNKDGGRFQLTSRNTFALYCYFMIAVSMMIAVIGTSGLMKKGLEGAFGESFVYQRYNVFPQTCDQEVEMMYPKSSVPVPAPGVPTREEQLAQCEKNREDSKLQEDSRIALDKKDQLVSGISLTLLSIIIFFLHVVLLRIIIAKDEHEDLLLLRKMFMISNTIFYGVSSIGVLVAFVSQITRYLLWDPAVEGKWNGAPPAPGETLALLPLLIIFWGILMFLFLKKARNEDK